MSDTKHDLPNFFQPWLLQYRDTQNLQCIEEEEDVVRCPADEEAHDDGENSTCGIMSVSACDAALVDGESHAAITECNNQEGQREKENYLSEISKQHRERWVIEGSARDTVRTVYSSREERFGQTEACRDQPHQGGRDVCDSERIPNGCGKHWVDNNHVAMDRHDCEERHVAVQAQEDAQVGQLAKHLAEDPATDVVDGPGDQRESEDDVGCGEMKKKPVSGALQTFLHQKNPEQEAVSW